MQGALGLIITCSGNSRCRIMHVAEVHFTKNIAALLLLKGGYLDFSHLAELKNICITEIYMKKQYKSLRNENHKITKKKFF